MRLTNQNDYQGSLETEQRNPNKIQMKIISGVCWIRFYNVALTKTKKNNKINETS